MNFIISSSIAYVSITCDASSNLSLVTVRDFNFYRMYESPQFKIIITKNIEKKKVVALTGDITAVWESTKKKSTVEYKVKTLAGTHYIHFKSETNKKLKIGYHIQSNQKYYFSNPDAKDCPLFTESINKNYLKSFSDTVNLNSIKKIIDPDTCSNSKIDKDSVDVLLDSLTTALNPITSPIISCFQSPTVFEKIKDDQRLAYFAAMTMSRYIFLVKNISDNKNLIKIKCTVDEPEIHQASLNQITTPEIISFNLLKLNNFNMQGIVGSMNHELFHSGRQLLPSVENKLDEDLILKLSCLCNNAEKKDISKHTENCKKSEINVFENKNKGGKGLTYVAEELKTIEKSNITAATVIAATPAGSTFQPLDSATINQLANTILTDKNGSVIPQDGSVHEAFLPPDMAANFSQVTNRITSVVAANTKLLGTIISNSSTPALAATSNSATRNPASVAATKANFENYTMNEYAADSMSKSFIQPDKESTALANSMFPPAVGANQKLSTFGGGNTLSKPTTNTESVQNSQGSLGSTNFASGTSASNTFNNTKNVSSKTSSSDSTSSLATSTDEEVSQETPANAPQSRTIASIDSAQANNRAPVDNVALRTLSAMNKVSGKEYVKIRSFYNDPSFSKQLKERGIRILVNTSNGKQITLGSTLNTATAFVDNGQRLEKIK
ncbi:MAG: hypothetical protein WA160_02085 [Pseudobdellovibrio sp.]